MALQAMNTGSNPVGVASSSEQGFRPNGLARDDVPLGAAIGLAAVHIDRGAGGRSVVELRITGEVGLDVEVRYVDGVGDAEEECRRGRP